MAIHHLTYEQYLQEKKEHAIKLAYTVWGYSVGGTVWGYIQCGGTVWGVQCGGTAMESITLYSQFH